MKKSIFTKIFSINLVSVLISILVLGVMQSILISQYVYNERINGLKENARNIARFVQREERTEHLTNFLYGFSHSTKTNIIIIDNQGNVLISAADEQMYNKNTLRIENKYCKEVLGNKENILRGTLNGVYKYDMLTLQLPVAANGDNVVGAIFISAPVPELAKAQLQLLKILSLSILFVIFLSFALSFALSRRLSRPIRRIGNTAKRFANGDFSSRVQLDAKASNIVEINELTTAFNDMAYSLEKADDIRNNFLSDVAHELRTPMTTISGFVDGVLDETIPPERQRDYLVIVRDEVSRLSALVTSFLNLTRIETGNQPLEIIPFDICETLRRTLVGFENKIEEKHINVELDIPESNCVVCADMNLIRQVLVNLTENAIKFTTDGGLIKISIKDVRNEFKISIFNTGCGISETDKKLIFERFYKADKSRSQNREGTGIGLYIVKDILNRHGKKIEVTSREDEFAEFSFSLEKGKN